MSQILVNQSSLKAKIVISLTLVFLTSLFHVFTELNLNQTLQKNNDLVSSLIVIMYTLIQNSTVAGGAHHVQLPCHLMGHIPLQTRSFRPAVSKC